MVENRIWDLVVIGGGTAGLVASRTAAGFGSRVLLIEEDRLGGDCLWTGCVPSKSLIAAAAAASIARDSTRLGISSTEVTVDFATVMEHVHAAMEIIAPDDSAESLERSGVAVMAGRATFTGAGTVEVDGRSIRFHQAFIATGGAPVLPRIPGADDVEVLTSSTFWNLRELPERLLVIGAGPIGCEVSQAMARLGSSVTLVHRGPRAMEREDRKAGDIVTAAMVADGVTLLLDRSVASFSTGEHGHVATLDDGSTVAFDAVLAATGRTPNTSGLGLETVGVHMDGRGNITVDDKLRTSNPRIWSAGDVNGAPQFTHTAGVNGSLGATNAVLGLVRTVDTVAIPRVTFTHPEVAAVGVQPSEAAGLGFRVRTIEHAHLDRAVCGAETAGYTSLVVDTRGRIRGGTIVGPRAGESLGEICLAVRHKLSTSDVASTTHAYPTFTDAVWKAAVADVQDRLGSGVIKRVIGVLESVRKKLIRRRSQR